MSQIFDPDDQYIDEDAVFRVRAALAVPYYREPRAAENERPPDLEHPLNVIDCAVISE